MRFCFIKYLLILLTSIMVSFSAYSQTQSFVVNGMWYDVTDEENAKVKLYWVEMDYELNDGAVIVPDHVVFEGINYTVSSIGSNAFSSVNASSIVIPESVELIASGAFYECSYLTSLTIPFVGKKREEINEWSMNEYHLFGYMFGSTQYVGSKKCTQHYNRSNSYSVYYYLPKDLKTVTVTGVDCFNGAFAGCDMLETINLPENLTEISHSMFYMCTGIKSISIPKTVSKIGDHAFTGCTGLMSLPTMDAVEYIGDYAFSGCTGLNTFNLPSRVKTLGNNAFSSCSGLTLISLPNNLTSVGEYAFYGCTNVTSVSFGNLRTISKGMFSGCSKIETIDFGENITTIGNSAFSSCSKIETIDFGENITTIGNSAFSSCKSITELFIPASVTTIDNSAFSNCSSLRKLEVANGASISYPDKYMPFEGCPIETLIYNRNYNSIYSPFAGMKTLKYVKIGEDVTYIKGGLLTECNAVETLILPFTGESYTSSDNDVYIGLGKIFGTLSVDAVAVQFPLSTSRTVSYKLPNSLQNVHITRKVGRYGLYKCPIFFQLHIDEGVTDIDEYAFKEFELESISLPKSLKTIGENAFKSSYIKSISFDSGIESFGSYAFSDCQNLKDIKFSSGVFQGGQYLFNNCIGLESVSLPNDLSEIPAGMFSGCTGLRSIRIPENVSKISNFAFYQCSSLSDIALPKGLISLGQNVFDDCTSLTNVVIPSGVVTIESGVFDGCINLRGVSIPNTIKSIGNRAFVGCTALTNVELSEGLESIGSSCFENCSNITTMILPNSLKSIGLDIFRGCSKLQSLQIPFLGNKFDVLSADETTLLGYLFGRSAYEGGVSTTQSYPLSPTSGQLVTYYIPASLRNIVFTGKKVFYEAFANCSMLTSITFSEGLEEIEKRAFAGCAGLESVKLPISVSSVAKDIFIGCSSLKDIEVPALQTMSNYFGTNQTLPLENIVITKGNIPSNCFEKCSNVKSIALADDITSFGASSFRGCSSLVSLFVPENVDIIQNSQFENCISLEEIYIPKKVNTIYYSAFKGCSNLTKVYYSGSEEDWSKMRIDGQNDALSNAEKVYMYGIVCQDDVFESDEITFKVVSAEDFQVEILDIVQPEGSSVFIPDSVVYFKKKLSVTGIADNVFSKLSNIESVRFAGNRVLWQKMDIGSGNDLLNEVQILYNCSDVDLDLSVEDSVNVVYISSQSLYANSSSEMKVYLRNEVSVTGFQFELGLPDGITLTTDDEGVYIAELSGDRTSPAKHNIFEVTKLKNGRYLFVCTTTNNSTFSGNDGEVIKFKINISNIEGDECTILLKNISVSDANAVSHRTTTSQITCEVLHLPYILGDANGDEKVNVGDITTVASYILGQNPAPFNSAAADANEDGKINVGDITFIASKILNGQ